MSDGNVDSWKIRKEMTLYTNMYNLYSKIAFYYCSIRLNKDNYFGSTECDAKLRRVLPHTAVSSLDRL
jgi:hypothetical protein